CALAMAALPAVMSHAQTYHTAAAPIPDVYVVMFRADWCAPCKIVEPRLSQALRSLGDSRIEYVNIDISGGHGAWNANAVFDRGIVDQYNSWMGITGFAAIIDGDTKRTLGCLNMNYETDAMATHIRNLQHQAQRNQQSFDLTCPAPNQPVGIARTG
ncbi:MAG: thioredoxin domain-containing protein, partial [Litorimonas sp.]